MRLLVSSVFLGFMLFFVAMGSLAQNVSSGTPDADNHEVLTCAPVPCVLPPTQVSFGLNLVNTTPIVANPTNPKQLLIGVNDFNCPQGTGPLAAYTSGDGGSTWNRATCMEGVDDYSPSILPGVGYDRNGTAFVAGDYLDIHDGGTGFIGVERSTDGTNWSAPVPVLARQFDYATESWLLVDTNMNSPYLNRVYVSADVPSHTTGVRVAHSSDSGVTWKSVNVGPPPSGDAEDSFTTMASGKDGTAHLTWMHCLGFGPSKHCDNGRAYMLFSKSSDGGDTWSEPSLMTPVTMPFHWSLPNTNDIRVYNYPAIGVDNSNGPYAGNLYVVMYTWTGTYMRVGVIRSTDGGKTWSKPVPVAPPSANHDQFFPWLSVSPTGLVGVSWLDRRNDPANVKYQAFAAISRDGGQSFQPNVQLTTAFSDPNVNGYPGGWMGDYTGNTWAGPNNFIAAWMDSSNGVNMQAVVGGIRLK